MPPTTASPDAAARHAHGPGCGHQSEAPAKARSAASPAASGPSLQVGAADHAYEQAADRTADRVLRRLADQGALGADAPAGGSPGRHPDAIGPEGGTVDGATAAEIEGARGGGAPLPGAVRRSMEGAFGADLGRVRLHTGPAAGALNARLGATAFTVGHDVFLGSGTPDLASRQGQHLLAHELAHTQQDGGGAQRATIRRNGGAVTIHTGSQPAPEPEREPVRFHVPAGPDLDDGPEPDHVTFHFDPEEEAERQAAPDAGKAEFDLLVKGSRLVESFRAATPPPEVVRTTAEKGALGLMVADGVSTATSGAAGKLTDREGGSTSEAVAAGRGAESAAPAELQQAESILETITKHIGLVKNAYKAVQDIYKAIDEKDLETGTVRKNTVNAVKSSVATGQSAMAAINVVLEPMGMVTGAMAAAVPGLGIAVGVLDLLSNGIALGIAYSGWSMMREDKRAAKKLLFDAKGIADRTTWYGSNRSGVELATAILADLTAAPDTRAAAEDYQLARSLQEIGGKRIRRNLVNIGLALNGIGADIAILTGVGAAAGTAMKTAGGGAKAGFVLARMGKQAAKDTFKIGMTTTKKLQAYDAMISAMTRKVIVTGGLSDTPDIQDKRDQALRPVIASGMSLKMVKLQVEEGKPDAGEVLWKAWVKALRNRDGS